jgi:hypothetical protein
MRSSDAMIRDAMLHVGDGPPALHRDMPRMLASHRACGAASSPFPCRAGSGPYGSRHIRDWSSGDGRYGTGLGTSPLLLDVVRLANPKTYWPTWSLGQHGRLRGRPTSHMHGTVRWPVTIHRAAVPYKPAGFGASAHAVLRGQFRGARGSVSFAASGSRKSG